MSIAPISAEKFYGSKPTEPKSSLDMKAFLQLLTVQLANQNPLEPMNDRDFFAQMAQLGQVQGMDKLTNQSEIQQIQDMMGKEITAVRPMTDGDTGQAAIVTGIATKLTIREGQRYVSLREADGGEVEVKVPNIQNVRDVARVEDSAHLVGKTVTSATVTGIVQGVTSVAGKIALAVQTPGGVVSVPLAELTGVSSG